ncbi:unnamed protein product [Symbiodinium sp. CCMP2592]|nr:unnamed protein product [Symbiodinium sp. CCMP2592]
MRGHSFCFCSLWLSASLLASLPHSKGSVLCWPHDACRLVNQTCGFDKKLAAQNSQAHVDLLVQRAHEVTTNFTVLHIGTNQLLDEELQWYQQLQRRIRQDTAGARTLRLFFVEPQPQAVHRLRERARQIQQEGVQITFIEAALCTENDTGQVFYILTERLYKDFPNYKIPRARIGFLSSFSKNRIREMVLQYATEQDFLSSPEVLDVYIDEISVRCWDAQGLLKQAGLKPADIDVLVTDLEGYDTQFLPFFFALEGFSPLSLTFEHYGQLLPSIVTQWTIRELAHRGYIVHCHRQDIIAIHLGSRPTKRIQSLYRSASAKVASLPTFDEELQRFRESGSTAEGFVQHFISPCLPMELATHRFGDIGEDCPSASWLPKIGGRAPLLELPAESVLAVGAHNLQALVDVSGWLRAKLVLVVARPSSTPTLPSLITQIRDLLKSRFIRHIFMQGPELSHPDYEALPSGLDPHLQLDSTEVPKQSNLIGISDTSEGPHQKRGINDSAAIAHARYVMREGETGDLTESRCWEAVAFGTIPISKYPKELYAALFCKGMVLVHDDEDLRQLALSLPDQPAYRKPSRDQLLVAFWKLRVALAIQKIKGIALPAVCDLLREGG